MKRWMYRLITASVMGIALSAGAQTPLDTVLERAVRYAPTLPYFEGRAAQAHARSVAEGTLPDPSIQMQYLPLPVETRVGPQRFRLSAMQAVGWPGLYRTRRATTRLDADAFDALRHHARREVVAYAATLYYEGAYWHDYLGVVEEQLLLLNMLDTIARERYRQGAASAVDIERIAINRQSLEWQRTQALAQADRIQSILRRWTRLPSIAFPPLEADSLPAELPTSPDRLHDSSWALAADSIRWEQARLVQRLYRLQTRPSVTLGGGYIGVGGGKDAVIAPSVGIRTPLFHAKNRALRQVGSTEVFIRKWKMHATQRRLADRLDRIAAQYRIAAAAYRMHRIQSQLAHHSLRLLLEDYATGRKGFWEVIDMFNQAFDHRKKALQSRWNQYRLRFEAEQIIGTIK